MSNDRYEETLDALAHEIWAVAQLAPGDGILDGVDRIVALLRREGYPAITHCDNCGCDWLDNGLNPVGCPYCELRREYVEDMRDVLKEAAQICKDLDDEALAKEGRLASGAECAAAIADVAARWNVPFGEQQ